MKIKPKSPVTLAEVLATVEAYVEAVFHAEASQGSMTAQQRATRAENLMRRRLTSLLRRAGLR